MGSFSIWHWVVVLLIILLLFGAKRIPELAKGLGSGIKNFKNAIKEDENEVAKTAEAKPVETTATAQNTQQTTTTAQATEQKPTNTDANKA
ncbi:MAG: twin-arginine translocase TatA/TatE family subunit [Campylobacteraceae bacterium]|jgi:sec-independent protein translocase protein TatA|nr:twin-arginine translocase TatA/TatE family subunit [Campylobacteraceae bacterium]